MKLRILPPAQAEILEAIDYFETRGRSVVRNFISDLQYTLRCIRDEPTAWTKLSKRTRKRNLFRFKYGVIYEVLESSIDVVAFINLLRGPKYWRRRLRGYE